MPRFYVYGLIKNDEEHIYYEVLKGLGHSIERETIRVPLANGSINPRLGPPGLVNTRQEAEAIIVKLKARLPHVDFEVKEES